MEKLNWVYEGKIGHSRSYEKKHSFHYPAFFLKLDVDRLASVNQRFFKFNRLGIFSIKSEDYLRGQHGDLSVLVRDFLKEQNLSFAPCRVELQTNPRILGYVFNPVSFWYLYDSADHIGGVLVEVNNTFGERHFYLLDFLANGTKLEDVHEAKKVFHVSPFFNLDGYYKFKFEMNEMQLRADIDYYSSEHQLKIATWISGRSSELNDKKILKLLGKYGWMSLMVIVRIHWQALHLWIKKITFFKKPEPPSQEVTR